MQISNNPSRHPAAAGSAAGDNGGIQQVVDAPVAGGGSPPLFGAQGVRTDNATRNRLSASLSGSPKAELRGDIEVVHKNPGSAVAFLNLGYKMTANERITVNSVSMTQRDCSPQSDAFEPATGVDMQRSRCLVSDEPAAISIDSDITVKYVNAELNSCLKSIANYCKAIPKPSDSVNEDLAHLTNELNARIKEVNDLKELPDSASLIDHSARGLQLKMLYMSANLAAEYFRRITSNHYRKIEKTDSFFKVFDRSKPLTKEYLDKQLWFNEEYSLKPRENEDENYNSILILLDEAKKRNNIENKLLDDLLSIGERVKAAILNPGNANDFAGLGNTLAANESIPVNNVSMTQRDCFQNALEIEPGNTYAQAALQRLDQAEAAAAASTAIVAQQASTSAAHAPSLATLAETVARHGVQLANQGARLTSVERRLDTHDRMLTHLQNDIASQLDAPALQGRSALPDNPHLLAYHLTFRKSMALLYTTTQMISNQVVRRDDPLLASALKAIAQSIPVPFLGAAVGALAGAVNWSAHNRAGTRATRTQSRLGEASAFTHLAHDVASKLCNDPVYRQRLLDLVPDRELAGTPASGSSMLQRLGLTRLNPAETLVQSQAESDVKRLSRALQADHNSPALQDATRALHADDIAPMSQWMSAHVLGRTATAVIAPMAQLSVRTVSNPHHPALIAELVEDGFLHRGGTTPDSPPSLRNLRIMGRSTNPEEITAAATAFYERTVAKGLQA